MAKHRTLRNSFSVHKCLPLWHAYDDKSLCIRTTSRPRDHCQKRRHQSWASRIPQVWRTKQEKHSGKGIAIAFATALFFNFSFKSFSRKVVQKFWGEVSVLSLPLIPKIKMHHRKNVFQNCSYIFLALSVFQMFLRTCDRLWSVTKFRRYFFEHDKLPKHTQISLTSAYLLWTLR